MNRRTAIVFITLVLLIGAMVVVQQSFVWPGYQTGYQPEQPIEFSHRLHSGQLQIDCGYCHSTADTGPQAGIPSVDTCMTCHSQVKGRFDATEPSQQIALIERAMESGNPIRWVRVCSLPDHVRFDHSRHVRAGVTCQSCHGPVETMEEIRQHTDLSMGWCVDCHRDWTDEPPTSYQPLLGDPGPSNDCSACHH